MGVWLGPARSPVESRYSIGGLSPSVTRWSLVSRGSRTHLPRMEDGRSAQARRNSVSSQLW